MRRRRKYNEIYKTDKNGNVLEICCLECEEWKKVKYFGLDKTKREGFNSYCLDCYNARKRKWDKDYKDENNEPYVKQYYKK